MAKWVASAMIVLASILMPTSGVLAQDERAMQTLPPTDTVDELFALPQLHRGHSIVLRLYWAVLDRKPELGGARFWIETYDAGEWDARRIASHFVVSAEFVGRYGALDNPAFVDLIYRNVLDRAPDAGGFQFWLDQVNEGMSRAEMVLLISNDTEFISSHPLPSDARPDTGPGDDRSVVITGDGVDIIGKSGVVVASYPYGEEIEVAVEGINSALGVDGEEESAEPCGFGGSLARVVFWERAGLCVLQRDLGDPYSVRALAGGDLTSRVQGPGSVVAGQAPGYLELFPDAPAAFQGDGYCEILIDDNADGVGVVIGAWSDSVYQIEAPGELRRIPGFPTDC